MVIVPDEVGRAPGRFHRLLREQQVTVLNQTPSDFNRLIKAEESSTEPPPLSLQWVILGGGTVNTRELKLWFDRHGDQTPKLVSLYGTAETTTYVASRSVSKQDLPQTKSLIGSLLPDVWIYILDSKRRPVPIGVPGELYVGGGGVAAGYLNRPELEARSFITDPYRQSPDARI